MQTQRKVRRRDEDGYILLALLLIVAMMAIAAAIVVPKVAFEIKRDREEEMIHRGVQYSRAIRAYYKKFGRYPTKIEDLESANNLRFLRKRYKDPENCKAGKCEDFKLLHFGDVQMSGSLGGGMIPGANTVGQMNGANGPQGAGGFGQQQSTFGGNTLGGNGQGGNSFGGANSFGGNGAAGTNATPPAAPGQQNGGDQANGTDTDSGTPATGTPGSGTPGSGTSGSGTQGGPGSSTGSAFGNGSANPVMGGGPIVGVTSGNKKDPTIREFNHKKKYSDWQFIYDPGTDRGGMIMTPYQPPITGFGQQGINGATPAANMTGNGATPLGGQNNGVGNSNSSGFGQQNPPTTQPTGNPPQQ
jgi:hypothetical protein